MEYTSEEATYYLSDEELPAGLADAFIAEGCPSKIKFAGRWWAVHHYSDEKNGEWIESDWDEHDFFGHRPGVGDGSFKWDGTYYRLAHLYPMEDPSTPEGAEDYGVWLSNLGHKVAQRFMGDKTYHREISTSATARAEWLNRSGLLYKTEWYKRTQI